MIWGDRFVIWGDRVRGSCCVLQGEVLVEVERSVVHSVHSNWATVIIRGSLRGAGSATQMAGLCVSER